MKKILLNLKTNMPIADTRKYLTKLNNLEGITKDFVIFLNHLKLFLSEENFLNISLGSQSFSKHGMGSFTSSNPIEQIIDFKNIDYFLLGHYEERKYFKVSNYDVNNQISKCLEFNKTAIVCFGESTVYESYDERIKFLIFHIEEMLKNITISDKIWLAYEPIYAIGSDILVDPNDINNVITDLKDYILNKYSVNISFLYGGNINQNNFAEFYKLKAIDGLLIGRYSLETKNVKEILNHINN